jgi:vanillate O-demethylase monooxygenase subunit
MYPFSEGSFAPRNAWYVATFSHEIGRHLIGRTILGEPVVVYGKEDGTAVGSVAAARIGIIRSPPGA